MGDSSDDPWPWYQLTWGNDHLRVRQRGRNAILISQSILIPDIRESIMIDNQTRPWSYFYKEFTKDNSLSRTGLFLWSIKTVSVEIASFKFILQELENLENWWQVLSMLTDRSKCGYFDRMSVMVSVMHDVMHDEGDRDDTNDRSLCSL